MLMAPLVLPELPSGRRVFESMNMKGFESSSWIVIVIAPDVMVAPVGLLSVSVNVSFAFSNNGSLVDRMVMFLLNSPGAKVERSARRCVIRSGDCSAVAGGKINRSSS